MALRDRKQFMCQKHAVLFGPRHLSRNMNCWDTRREYISVTTSDSLVHWRWLPGLPLLDLGRVALGIACSSAAVAHARVAVRSSCTCTRAYSLTLLTSLFTRSDVDGNKVPFSEKLRASIASYSDRGCDKLAVGGKLNLSSYEDNFEH